MATGPWGTHSILLHGVSPELVLFGSQGNCLCILLSFIEAIFVRVFIVVYSSILVAETTKLVNEKDRQTNKLTNN